jgi:hypothetical protein
VYARTFLTPHPPKLTRSKITSVEYSCPRSRVYTGTRRPEETGAYPGCRSSPTSLADMPLSTLYRKNSKSWQRLRAQLSLHRSAPPYPQHLQLHRRRRSHLYSLHARALPCQFPVELNANLRIMLSYSPMRRARAQDPSESVAAVAYRRHWAKCNDQAPQKRASLAYGPGHLKSSA